MSKIVAFLKNEPAALSAIVSALITLAAAFGLHLSAEQTSAIGAVVMLVTGFITRSFVTPTAKKDPAGS